MLSWTSSGNRSPKGLSDCRQAPEFVVLVNCTSQLPLPRPSRRGTHARARAAAALLLRGRLEQRLLAERGQHLELGHLALEVRARAVLAP